MNKNNRMALFGALIIIVSIFLLLGGCASTPRQPERFLDTPEHHVLSGFKLINKNRFDDALREFELALEYDQKNSSAQRGKGLAYGMKKQLKPAFESMSLARDYAKNKEEKAMAYVGFMRLYTIKKDKGWLREVEKSFDMARSVIKDLPEAYFYMGIGYKYGYQFADSAESLKKVLEINGAFIDEADKQLRILKKIERAGPASELGKRVAVLDRVTRADVAALFLQELRLDRIYKKTHSKQPIPPDVENHALKKYLKVILQLDIQGLRPFPDGTFGPDEYITRAGYAIMIANIIATIENNPSLNTRYKGSASPFRDVHNDVYYFNAIMVCTSRGEIMEAKNGIFNPMGKVSGVDALFILKKFMKELKI